MKDIRILLFYFNLTISVIVLFDQSKVQSSSTSTLIVFCLLILTATSLLKDLGVIYNYKPAKYKWLNSLIVFTTLPKILNVINFIIFVLILLSFTSPDFIKLKLTGKKLFSLTQLSTAILFLSLYLQESTGKLREEKSQKVEKSYQFLINSINIYNDTNIIKNQFAIKSNTYQCLLTTNSPDDILANINALLQELRTHLHDILNLERSDLKTNLLYKFDFEDKWQRNSISLSNTDHEKLIEDKDSAIRHLLEREKSYKYIHNKMEASYNDEYILSSDDNKKSPGSLLLHNLSWSSNSEHSIKAVLGISSYNNKFNHCELLKTSVEVYVKLLQSQLLELYIVRTSEKDKKAKESLYQI